MQPQSTAAFGLINSRTPFKFTFLAPQTADGFVICLNNYCNKEANSVAGEYFPIMFSHVLFILYILPFAALLEASAIIW